MLKNRHTMIDTTYSLLLDFLNLEIILVERPNDEEENKEEE